MQNIVAEQQLLTRKCHQNTADTRAGEAARNITWGPLGYARPSEKPDSSGSELSEIGTHQ
ncbi:MAG: hypothetical protein IPI02_01055 [Sterolibacteriaceae bacterium]|nr:hypothetical protein [Sterolibacteriaceae bacterium]